MNKIVIIHTRAHQYRDQIVRLWKECLPGTPEERFDWLASGNPAGPAEWFLALDAEDVLFAASSIMPKEFFCNGRTIKGGIVGDIMVTAGARGQGIARQIQEKITDSLAELGMEFFYVVPNNKSQHLFLSSGEMLKTRLINYLIPVDIEHYLKKIGWHFSIKWPGRCLELFLNRFFSLPSNDDYFAVSSQAVFDKEIDILWESVKVVPDVLVGSKSMPFLTWKYCTGMNQHFRILKYRTASGRLTGYCVFLISEKKIHLYELVTAEKAYYMRMIAALRSFAREEHCVGIYFYTTSQNPILKQLWWQGFIRIGGDMDILCFGKIFEKKYPWLFFAGDRNL